MNEPSSQMLSAFRSGGVHGVHECACGIFNFPALPMGAAEYYEDEIERLKYQETLHPDQYYCHENCNSIITYDIQGNVFAFGCPCNTLYRYERFILEHKENILSYLLMLKEARRNADEMLDQLKEPK